MKIFSLMLILGFFCTTASANSQKNSKQIKVGGHVFGNLFSESHENTSGKQKAFALERARLKVDAKIDENWKAHLAFETSSGKDVFMKKVYLHGRDVILANDYFRVGVISNLYKDTIYKHTTTRWLNKLGVHDNESTNSVKGEHGGIRYGYKTGPMHFALDIHNGEEKGTVDTTSDADAANDQIGYSFMAEYEMGMHGFHLFYYATSKSTFRSAEVTADTKAKNTMAFDYTFNNELLDLVAEYSVHDNGSEKPTRIHLTTEVRYSPGKSVLFAVNKDKDDVSGDSATSKDLNYIIGPVFKVTKGIKTALTYEVQTYELDSTEDEKTIAWNFETKF